MRETCFFKDRLIEAMKSKGLTQAKLGELMNVNQTTISRWLNGKREPDYLSLLMLCSFLDETPNNLLGYSKERSTEFLRRTVVHIVEYSKEFQKAQDKLEKELKEKGVSYPIIEIECEKLFQEHLKRFCEHYNLDI